MNKNLLWKLQTLVMAAILCVGFTSCGDKDDPELPEPPIPVTPTPYEKLSEDEKMIIGAWDPDGIEENWDSYGKWIFLADHTCEYYYTEKTRYEYFHDCYYDYRKISEKKTGVWEYNSLTKQLTTTINGTYWIIGLMTNDAWTGTSANYGAVTYKRNNIEFAKYYLRKFGLIATDYFEFNLKDDILKAEEDASPDLYKGYQESGRNDDWYNYRYGFTEEDGDYNRFPSGSDSYLILNYQFNITNLTSTEIQCKIGLGKYYEYYTYVYENTWHGYYVDDNGNETDYYNASGFVYIFNEYYDSPRISNRYVGYFDGTLTLTDYYTANPKLVLDGQTMQTKKPYKKEITLTEK